MYIVLCNYLQNSQSGVSVGRHQHQPHPMKTFNVTLDTHKSIKLPEQMCLYLQLDTPLLCSYETFQKMKTTQKSWCLMSSPRKEDYYLWVAQTKCKHSLGVTKRLGDLHIFKPLFGLNFVHGAWILLAKYFCPIVWENDD